MLKTLHGLMGSISFKDVKGRKVRGSGCLISPNLVLTAGHNIFNPKIGELNVDFEFLLAPYGTKRDRHQI